MEISNDESDFYTIVDVLANDRLGLLHDLTRVIAEHGYEIYISKAGTVLDQVSDTLLPEGRRRPEDLGRGRDRGAARDLLAAMRVGGRECAPRPC